MAKLRALAFEGVPDNDVCGGLRAKVWKVLLDYLPANKVRMCVLRMSAFVCVCVRVCARVCVRAYVCAYGGTQQREGRRENGMIGGRRQLAKSTCRSHPLPHLQM
jgi:hypothetical protein